MELFYFLLLGCPVGDSTSVGAQHIMLPHQYHPIPSSPDSRLPIHQDLPTMGVTSSPNHQMLSRSFMSSASEVCSGSTFLPHQVLNAGPRKQRKERTVYTKEQKLLLQEHFKQCMYPSSDRRNELARIVGVTEREIKVCPFLT